MLADKQITPNESQKIFKESLIDDGNNDQVDKVPKKMQNKKNTTKEWDEAAVKEQEEPAAAKEREEAVAKEWEEAREREAAAEKEQEEPPADKAEPEEEPAATTMKVKAMGKTKNRGKGAQGKKRVLDNVDGEVAPPSPPKK